MTTSRSQRIETKLDQVEATTNRLILFGNPPFAVTLCRLSESSQRLMTPLIGKSARTPPWPDINTGEPIAAINEKEKRKRKDIILRIKAYSLLVFVMPMQSSLSLP